MDTAPQNPAPDTAHTPRQNKKGQYALSGSQFFRLAHRLSDAVNDVRIQLAKRWKFVPQTIAYQGYGSTTRVRVLGRVLLTQKPPPGSKAEHAARNGNQNIRGWRAFTGVPLQFSDVEITIGDVVTHVTADRGASRASAPISSARTARRCRCSSRRR